MARYIFVTGGVVSSLGKGLSSASLAYLLQSRGFKVRIRKLDPYLNVDPGTMSPFQHGEVFVTDDGAETDLDLGHYERFIDVDLSKIIIRETDMKPEEILISESQERMLFIINKTSQKSFLKILEKYDLDYSIIGTVIKEPSLKIRHKNQLIANLPISLISEAPLQHHSQSKPKYLNNIEQKPPNPTNYDIVDITMKLLSSPNIANKKWIYRQYDHEVGIRTIIKPGDADSSILKLPNNKYLAITSDGNSKHCYLDPYYGSAGCVSESCRNIIAMGAKPIGIVDHCQFGDPTNEEIFWTFCVARKNLKIRLLTLFIELTKRPLAF